MQEELAYFCARQSPEQGELRQGPVETPRPASSALYMYYPGRTRFYPDALHMHISPLGYRHLEVRRFNDLLWPPKGSNIQSPVGHELERSHDCWINSGFHNENMAASEIGPERCTLCSQFENTQSGLQLQFSAPDGSLPSPCLALKLVLLPDTLHSYRLKSKTPSRRVVRGKWQLF